MQKTNIAPSDMILPHFHLLTARRASSAARSARARHNSIQPAAPVKTLLARQINARLNLTQRCGPRDRPRHSVGLSISSYNVGLPSANATTIPTTRRGTLQDCDLNSGTVMVAAATISAETTTIQEAPKCSIAPFTGERFPLKKPPVAPASARRSFSRGRLTARLLATAKKENRPAPAAATGPIWLLEARKISQKPFIDAETDTIPEKRLNKTEVKLRLLRPRKRKIKRIKVGALKELIQVSGVDQKMALENEKLSHRGTARKIVIVIPNENHTIDL